MYHCVVSFMSCNYVALLSIIRADGLTYYLGHSIAWYIAAANLLTAETSFFVLPVVDLRYVFIKIVFVPLSLCEVP